MGVLKIILDQGEEKPANISLYRCIKSTKRKPQTITPSACISLSLSLSLPYALYTSECVC